VATLLHLTDTHLGADPGEFVLGRDADGRLATVLAAWAATGETADLIVHTGDCSEDGSAAAIRRLAGLLAPLGVPVLALAGNHDDPEAVRAAFPCATVAELGAWRVVGLATAAPQRTSGVIDVPAALAALDALDTRPTVIALHHPPRCRSTHEWFRLEGAEPLLDGLAVRPHVRLVLSGHLHDAFELDGPGGLALLGGPSTFVAITHDGDEMQIGADAPMGVRVLHLRDDGTFTARLVVA